MPFLIHSGSATNNSQTKSKHTCVHTHTPVYSQSCDLDELAQQLHSLRQWLALQDLSSDPVLHLAAPLQYQLEVEGAPSRLLSMEHITHKLHLFKHRNPVGTCSDFFLISALKGEADVENWNVCVCAVCALCLTSCTQLKSSQSNTTSWLATSSALMSWSLLSPGDQWISSGRGS